MVPLRKRILNGFEGEHRKLIEAILKFTDKKGGDPRSIRLGMTDGGYTEFLGYMAKKGYDSLRKIQEMICRYNLVCENVEEEMRKDL